MNNKDEYRKRQWFRGRLLFGVLLMAAFAFLALGGGIGRQGSQEKTLPGQELSSDYPETEEQETDPASAEMQAADSDTGVSGTDISDTAAAVEGMAENQASEICVHVCGYVQRSGVYALAAGSRVRDAVNAAGGFKKDADREYWNLAETVMDGEQIRIPSLEEASSMEADGKGSAAGNGSSNEKGAGSGTDTGRIDSADSLVNLNTAGKEELMTLTGIGEMRADAIISYRENSGPFTSIEEIMNVSGIKEASFQKIKDHITV
ncbi:MAG: helix-hairpin-helix domain-containing protein [Clostridiales bacterium]|nr:helix-hairpin-helix domain-containing protein [Clostridiales bacterium]